jgi:chromosome partitioning protein
MNSLVADSFLPLLEGLGMSLDSNKYAQLRPDYKDSLCLAQIADFNTLIATSQKHQVPVFAIEDEMFGHVGTVLEIDQGKREEFRTVFKTLAEEVVSLTT